MAESVVTVVPNGIGTGGLPGYTSRGTLVVGASPGTYTIGGILLNLNQALVKASRTPISVTITGIAGYIYEYIKGTDNSNGKLMIRAQTNAAAAGDPLGELAASAIPAGVSGDTITYTASYAGNY